jgi:anti-sigma regulatory factor (Ser/Thr protein kinase)
MPARVQLPRAATCAAQARRFVRAQLSDLGDKALEPVMLTVSELVTNAWKHGEGAIELRLGRAVDRVRVEVVDEGSGERPRIRGDAGETGGWGLRIVDEVSSQWGAFEGTMHVWADVPIRD